MPELVRPTSISLDATLIHGLPNATKCGHKYAEEGKPVVCKKPCVYYRDLQREGPACVDHLEAVNRLKRKADGEAFRARRKARALRLQSRTSEALSA